MLAQTYSLAHIGAHPHRVTIETDAYNGLPGIKIVGLPSKAIEEARERLRSAIRNSGLEFPARKFTINMAPADIAKSGTGYELAMAIGILLATRQISKINDTTCFVAELALDGSLRPAKDCLASVLAAQQIGFKTIVVDPTTMIDHRLCRDITILRPATLKDYYLHCIGEKTLSAWIPDTKPARLNTPDKVNNYDIGNIHGLSLAKRALEIAAAGHHNILLIGPPGAGKTLLAQSLPSILPAASIDEARQIYYLHSLANQPAPSSASGRPFRAPHHTSSEIAVVGGGTRPRPGEISLAHNGVLFMDEFVEFPRSVLEALRQPLEDGTIHIARAAESLIFPADVLLVAAMNPCPCGYYDGADNSCSCPASRVERYLSRLSGPLLDRFDLICYIKPLSPVDWSGQTDTPDRSCTIKLRIESARARQSDRQPSGQPFVPNSRLPLANLDESLLMSDVARDSLLNMVAQEKLSARGLTRCQKVARTIADLAGSKLIEPDHLGEALYYKQQTILKPGAGRLQPKAL